MIIMPICRGNRIENSNEELKNDNGKKTSRTKKYREKCGQWLDGLFGMHIRKKRMIFMYRLTKLNNSLGFSRAGSALTN